MTMRALRELLDRIGRGGLLTTQLWSTILCLGLHASDDTCMHHRSLSSKVVSQYSSLLSPMAVDSVLRVLDPKRPEL